MSLVCRRVKALRHWEELCAADVELCAPVGESSGHRRVKALCHNSKQTIQEFGTSRILVLLSLQGKTLFIRQIKVAKTAKAKLCATTQSKLSKNSAQAEFLCFCTRLLVKHEFPAFAKKNAVSLTNQGCKDCQNEALCTGGKKLCVPVGESSVPQLKANYPRIRHKPNSCAFAQGYW